MKSRRPNSHRAIFITLAILAKPAFAGGGNWICGDGSWNTASCWSSGSAPANNDSALITNPNLNASVSYGSGSVGINILNVGDTIFQQSGGALEAGSEFVGGVVFATYNQTDGTNTVDNTLTVGGSSLDGVGTYNLSGGTLTVNQTYVGANEGGSGTFTLLTGTHTTVGLTLDKGNYTLAGGALTVSNLEKIGVSNDGSFTQSAGTHVVSTLLIGASVPIINAYTTDNGTYTLKAGDLTVSAEAIGTASHPITGHFNQSGGTHTVNSLWNFGTYNFTGGAVNATTLNNSGVLNIGNIGIAKPSNNRTAVLTLSNTLNNTGNIIVAADSQITGNGVFTQTQGKTIVDGSMMLSAINLNGGVLSGSGTVSSLTINGGTVAPGDPQTLTVNGDLRMNSGVLDFKIADANDYDKIIASGGIYLLGGTIEFDFIGGYTPHAGDTFEFLQGDVQTLSNLNFIYTGLAPGFEFNTAFGSSGLSITALNDGQPVASVPLPTSAWLFGSGILGLMGLAKRRAQS